MTIYIASAFEIVDELEKLKGYYDETGLDMHIAVVPKGTRKSDVIVSTKHWIRVHYIHTDKTSDECWNTLEQISKLIGRTFIKSEKGNYVYVNKLNLKQTQSVFDIFKEYFGKNITRIWEMSWDIAGSVTPY